MDSPSGKSTEQAAKVVKVGRQYISDAKKLKADAPEVYEAVKAGTLNMYPTMIRVVNLQ